MEHFNSKCFCKFLTGEIAQIFLMNFETDIHLLGVGSGCSWAICGTKRGQYCGSKEKKNAKEETPCLFWSAIS